MVHAVSFVSAVVVPHLDWQADFSYYFDTGGRRRCYLAPERFFEGSPGAINTAAPLQPDMVRTQQCRLQPRHTALHFTFALTAATHV
jgi:hypothetical protein